MSDIVDLTAFRQMRQGERPWEYRGWLCATRRAGQREIFITYMKKMHNDDPVVTNLTRIVIEVRGTTDFDDSITKAKKRIDTYERNIAEQRAILHNP